MPHADHCTAFASYARILARNVIIPLPGGAIPHAQRFRLGPGWTRPRAGPGGDGTQGAAGRSGPGDAARVPQGLLRALAPLTPAGLDRRAPRSRRALARGGTAAP